MGVPRERAAGVYRLIVEGADELGLLREIKGKKYVNLSSKGAARSKEISRPSDIADEVSEPGDTVVDEDFADDDREQTPVIQAQNKRVFITHGRNKGLVDPIKKLLSFGEMEAVVSVERQSVSQPVPEKVMNDMRECGAAIIHVEGEMTLIDSDAKEHIVLNPNVLIEIGAAMALYGKRFVLLVKDGVKLPSNLQGLYEVRYAGDTLDGDATIRLLEAINQLKKI
jgi:predicted nucleotide-binding protein